MSNPIMLPNFTKRTNRSMPLATSIDIATFSCRFQGQADDWWL